MKAKSKFVFHLSQLTRIPSLWALDFLPGHQMKKDVEKGGPLLALLLSNQKKFIGGDSS